jgi:hypothetical protein
MNGTDAVQPEHGESEVMARHRKRRTKRVKREKLVTGA